MVGFDAFGRAAVGAASFVLFQERVPLREGEVGGGRPYAPLVAGDTDIGPCSLEIPRAPLFVVVERGTRILRVFLFRARWRARNSSAFSM